MEDPISPVVDSLRENTGKPPETTSPAAHAFCRRLTLWDAGAGVSTPISQIRKRGSETREPLAVFHSQLTAQQGPTRFS